MQRTVDYIERHLTRKITLQEISAQANLSVSHLYRIFPAFAGCTIGQYIRRRRLTEAARSLYQGGRVLDVALEYQFESQESFTRAFKSMLGMTPGEYKRNTPLIPAYLPIQIRDGEKGEISVQPDIRIRQFILIGMETRIDLITDFTQRITALTAEVKKRLPSTENVVNPPHIINMWYPQFENDIPTSEPATMYFTGVEIAGGETSCNGMVVKAFPESLYAVFQEKQRGTIGGPNGYAYGLWLPSSGYVLNQDIPGDFEEYLDTEHTGYDAICKIWVPILASVGEWRAPDQVRPL